MRLCLHSHNYHTKKSLIKVWKMSFIMFIQLIVISIHFFCLIHKILIAHPFCFLGEKSRATMWFFFFTVGQKRNCFITVPWNICLDLGRIMSWVHSQVVLNWVWCAGKNADANSRWNGFKLSRIPPNCSHLNQHGNKKKKKAKAQFLSFDCSLEEDQQHQCCVHSWQVTKHQTIQLMRFKKKMQLKSNTENRDKQPTSHLQKRRPAAFNFQK